MHNSIYINWEKKQEKSKNDGVSVHDHKMYVINVSNNHRITDEKWSVCVVVNRKLERQKNDNLRDLHETFTSSEMLDSDELFNVDYGGSWENKLFRPMYGI